MDGKLVSPALNSDNSHPHNAEPLNSEPKKEAQARSDRDDSSILCVDLDGTLLATDAGWEAFFTAIRHDPWSVVRAAFSGSGGWAGLKHRLALLATLDLERLPYNQSVLDLIRAERNGGRVIVLVTGADESLAQCIANHLGLFDDVLASDGKENLIGRRKVKRIRDRFGDRPFDYIGDSLRDLPVWKEARRAYAVAPSPILKILLKALIPETQIVPSLGSQRFFELVISTRPLQWLKNLLVFVPMILAHQLSDVSRWTAAAVAFICFVLVASAGYLLNDLLDLSYDREHPVKSRRPLASGKLRADTALSAAMFLALGAIALAFIYFGIGTRFSFYLILYLLLTGAYSVALKRLALVDVFTLAALYTARILGGAAAVDVSVSRWLIAFSMFFFLSLAFAKRLAELSTWGSNQDGNWEGRGYSARDVAYLQSVGIASGYLAALVIAFYVDSPEVMRLYSHPKWLWLTCPILLYWISRIYLLAQRGDIQTDPLAFALTDKTSYYIAVCVTIIALIAL